MKGLFISIFWLTFCSFIPIKNIEITDYVGKLSSEHGKLLKKKEFYLYGTGGSLLGGLVRVINLDFFLERKISLEKARGLYINSVEPMVAKVNEDKIIRIYLHDYPCTYKNIEVMLSFHDKKNKYYDDSIALIYQVRGIIYYEGRDNASNKFVEIYQEPYETALQIVRDQEKKPSHIYQLHASNQNGIQ